jgi:hypothetical protein
MYQSYYGVNTDSNIHWKKDANVLFMGKFYLLTEYGKETYATYCEDGDLDPDDDQSKEDFVDSYENDTYGWYGLEGLIVDYINDYECDHQVVFRHEDSILGVMPTIPANDEERSKILTQEQIRVILATYLTELLEEPVVIDWYDIYE